jgi:hypothetical protein
MLINRQRAGDSDVRQPTERVTENGQFQKAWPCGSSGDVQRIVTRVQRSASPLGRHEAGMSAKEARHLSRPH